jgi:hypothetical protein
VAASSSQGGRWPGQAAELLGQLGLSEEERGRLGGELGSRKTSQAHRAVIAARDRALQEFVRCVEIVAGSGRLEREESAAEKRWWEHWTQSLHSLAQLYS